MYLLEKVQTKRALFTCEIYDSVKDYFYRVCYLRSKAFATKCARIYVILLDEYNLHQFNDWFITVELHFDPS